jgi:hypothetical protein
MTATLVLLRHGESAWNRENRFTGWHDVPLTDSGLEESRAAAEMMAAAKIHPGVLHTSMLLRAIQTANAALEELSLAWLPVRRSWRLNERHYGAPSSSPFNPTTTTVLYTRSASAGSNIPQTTRSWWSRAIPDSSVTNSPLNLSATGTSGSLGCRNGPSRPQERRSTPALPISPSPPSGGSGQGFRSCRALLQTV